MAVLVDWIAKRVFLRGISKLITRSNTQWDDALIEHKVLDRIAHLAPLYLLHILVPVAFEDWPRLVAALGTIITVLMVIVVLGAVDGTINAFFAVYQRFAISQRIYLRGFVQVIKFFVFAFGTVVILSRLIGQ